MYKCNANKGFFVLEYNDLNFHCELTTQPNAAINN